MTDHVSLYAAVLMASALADVVAGVVVWRRRASVGRNSLVVVLLAAAVWSFAYALQLLSGAAGREFWGALKYVGTTVLPPAWLVFALQYTGRWTRSRPRVLCLLAIEPVLVLSLLAYGPTRSLIRSYPRVPAGAQPTVRLGTVYWLHFLYTNVLVVAAGVILLAAVVRVSRLYWRQSLTLLVAIFLPALGNAMSSLNLAPFENLDPSPVAVSLAAWVLVVGVLRYRLLDLRPVARTLVVETMPDAVLVVDAHGHVVDLNPAAQQLLRRTATEAIGGSADVLLAEHGIAGWTRPGTYDVRLHAGDDARDLELVVTPLADPRGATAGRVLVLRDVSERRDLERSLRRLAYTDPLTALPNRALFHDRLRQALASSGRHDGRLAVFFLDLDRFKTINDSLGHEIGDRVLSTVARRLRDRVRAEDTLARLGGDEFAVLCPDIADPADVRLVADRLLAALAAPLSIAQHEITVETSIGVAVYPDDAHDAQHLLRGADAAMYRAKTRGGGRMATYTPELGEQIARRHQLEVELRRALRAAQLRLLFQPYHALATNALAGYEALVRWSHPESGLLAPASFLGLAEHIGLIEAVDRWVLEHACHHARAWPSTLTISVNVSAARLRSGDLAQHTSDTLRRTGLHPSRLTLELSERTLFDEDPDPTAALAELATTGIGLALDDFGAGYTSLEHLRRLPVTQLKIDRSLIHTLGHHSSDTPILAAIINFAHTLGLTVTAEGIEQPDQLCRLKALACEYGQGYLFSPPLPTASPPTRPSPKPHGEAPR